MIRRPARGRRIDPFKSHLGQIERLDKNVDYTNRIVLADPVFHAFRKQRALPTIDAFDKALHPIPLKIPGNRNSRITPSSVFSHSQGQKPTFRGHAGPVRFTADKRT
jgi:hypothetical protein